MKRKHKLTNSKLLRILRLFNEDELKSFKLFLSSPFLNSNKKCRVLYNLLIQYAPDFSNEAINDPIFLHSIYREKNSQNSLMNEFIRLMENFMIQIKLNEREGIRRYFLMEELAKRGEDKHFDLVYDRSLKKFDNKKSEIQSYHDIYLNEVSYLRRLYKRTDNQQILVQQLKKSIIAFDKYMLSTHLWLDNTIYNARLIEPSKKVYEMTQSLKEKSEVFYEMAHHKLYFNEVLIELHLILRELYITKSEEKFEVLRSKLKKHHTSIDSYDYGYFYTEIVNYSIEKIVSGDKDYYEKLLDIYRFAMDSGAFIKDGYLAPKRLKNTIVLAVRLRKFEFAHEILEKYTLKLEPKYQAPFNTYYKGYAYFHEKQYEEAITSLNECFELKSLFELDAKSMLYKIYYYYDPKQYDDDTFNGDLRALRVKLKRYERKRKYSKYIIEGYINFFELLKLIYLKKTNPHFKKSFSTLQQMINDAKYVSDRVWLKKILNELEKGRSS